MLCWVAQAAREAGCGVHVVVGHQAEQVRSALGQDVATSLQDPPMGTGHAVAMAAADLPREGVLLVLAGDTPLLRPETLRNLLASHGSHLCTVLTACIRPEEAADSGYGRVVRDEQGDVSRIVEAAELGEERAELLEINTGVYAFDARWLLEDFLPTLQPHPPKGELYLTDAIEAAAANNGLQAVLHPNLSETMGVNDRVALAEATRVMRSRINRTWMQRGVTLIDPDTTYLDAQVELSADVELAPGVQITGSSTLCESVTVGANAQIHDCHVEAGASIGAGAVCQGARIGPEAVVGPMARLREGSDLGARSHVGNFVEVKKTRLGAGAKANHLSYLGDCEVGADANVGAGTITCNYDGHSKHTTTIGEKAFIGSNTALVAPVHVGNKAIVGAGSVITSDVPDNALAIARSRQENLDGKASTIHDRNARQAADSEPEKSG